MNNIFYALREGEERQTELRRIHIAAIHELSFQAAQENMPRRNTRAVWCQVNMTDRHFSSSAMIKMMGSSLKEL